VIVTGDWSNIGPAILSHMTGEGIVAMDARMIEAIARRAGLEKAFEAYPDDVAAAAISAEKATDRIRQSIGTLSESLSEPWPPMIVVGR
jgi:hypothetical protein